MLWDTKARFTATQATHSPWKIHKLSIKKKKNHQYQIFLKNYNSIHFNSHSASANPSEPRTNNMWLCQLASHARISIHIHTITKDFRRLRSCWSRRRNEGVTTLSLQGEESLCCSSKLNSVGSCKWAKANNIRVCCQATASSHYRHLLHMKVGNLSTHRDTCASTICVHKNRYAGHWTKILTAIDSVHTHLHMPRYI